MSLGVPEFGQTVVVRANEAETIGQLPQLVRLLVDAEDTGGALSTHRVSLGRGADGARPHRHDRSAELFYVLDGAVDVLSGSNVRSARTGDLVVVPPHTPHAFAAHPNQGTELLIVISPGVQRFEYFRQLGRIVRGEASPESLLTEQERYDTYFLDSPEWTQHRNG